MGRIKSCIRKTKKGFKIRIVVKNEKRNRKTCSGSRTNFRKKGVKIETTSEQKSEKRAKNTKKNIKTQQSEKLVQTKILEIETQEHLVLIFFAHFAFCVFTKKYQLKKIRTRTF